jgi:hypothetical protein
MAHLAFCAVLMAHLAFCTLALVAMQRLLRHGIEGEARQPF